MRGVVVMEEWELRIERWGECGYGGVDLLRWGRNVGGWSGLEYLEEGVGCGKVE